MTTQYNIAIKVLDTEKEWMIQHVLQGYRGITDEHGNLKGTIFSREQLPYVGEMIVFKTLNPEAAQYAHRVFTGLEKMLVLPITECDWEEDKRGVATFRTQL